MPPRYRPASQGFEDSDDGDGNEEPSGKRYSGGSVGRTQAGFLSGVNMASQRTMTSTSS